jgi:MFS transporter, ACDE family, multidrug resistance protein
MAIPSVPFFLRRSPTPKVEHFAILTGIEAAVRGTLISAMPLAIYDALGTAEATSLVYFAVGVLALIWGLMVPWATRWVPRRWAYTAGASLYVVGMVCAVVGGPVLVPLGLLTSAMATATTFVCLNAYVLDYVDRSQLGRSQSTQMLYAAAPWAIGPVLGVWLRSLWEPAPFLLAGAFALALIVVFWVLRLGNGRQIARAKGPAPNPVAYLGRFMRQPRLIAGWLFAVLRSCGWWVYVVYLPIYCIEAGLGDKVGGIALSLSNAMLFTTPFMLAWVNRGSVRGAVRIGFGACGLLFILSTFTASMPWVTVAIIMLASVALVLLDVVGGLPFLMAVKPSERVDMAAVYSSFRDVSGILTPGVAWLVLLAMPLPAVFAVCGLGLGAAWAVAGRLHPRLGTPRPSHGTALPAE